jgi:hypothetical protein
MATLGLVRFVREKDDPLDAKFMGRLEESR